MGIKALTSATLVPFALLFGRDAFKDFVFDEPEQAGGGKVKIPKNRIRKLKTYSLGKKSPRELNPKFK